MKVPQYREKLARTKTSGGGVLLQAQANPNAFGAMGMALSNIGDDIYKFGAEKYKIQATSDANELIPLFSAAIETHKINNQNLNNPLKAEQTVQALMKQTYKDYVSGKLKNPADNNPYLSSNLSKRLFSAKASEIVTKGILGWKKLNNAHIVEMNKINQQKIISDNNKIASNILATEEDRRTALYGNHSKSYVDIKNLNKKFKGMKTGMFPVLAANGTFNAKELTVMQNKSFEDIVLGISTSLVGSNRYRPKMVTEAIRQSINNPEILKKVDPILSEVWKSLDGKQRDSLLDKIRDMENDYKKDLKDKKSEADEASTAANDKINIAIKNVDLNSPSLVDKAKADFQKLKKNKYYTKLAEMNGIQRLLYPTEESKSIKSTREATRTLTLLAQNNQLTIKAIDDLGSSLNDTDYRYWTKELESESDDAAKFVIDNSINLSFNMDKYTAENKNSIEELDNLRIRAISDFNIWRNTKDGLKATFQEVVDRGEFIMNPIKLKISAVHKKTFDTKINGFKSTYKDPFKSSGKLYTRDNVLTYLTDLQAKWMLTRDQPEGQILSWQKKFQIYEGIIGAESWNQ